MPEDHRADRVDQETHREDRERGEQGRRAFLRGEELSGQNGGEVPVQHSIVDLDETSDARGDHDLAVSAGGHRRPGMLHRRSPPRQRA